MRKVAENCTPKTYLLYHFDQLFGHMSQGCPKRRVCLCVTGHTTFWRQWQLIFGAFRPKILPKTAISKRFSSCHTAWQQLKSCASLRGGHRSQAANTWSKWYSIHSVQRSQNILLRGRFVKTTFYRSVKKEFYESQWWETLGLAMRF